jgi:hypothetical protein
MRLAAQLTKSSAQRESQTEHETGFADLKDS